MPAQRVAEELKKVLDLLPTAPTNEKDTRAALQSFWLKNPKEYSQLRHRYKQLRKLEKSNTHEDIGVCIKKYLGEPSRAWLPELAKVWDTRVVKPSSSQFREGTHRQYELGWGGSNFGRENESASINARAMFSYTFGRCKGERRHIGGHWRVLGGPDWLYEQRVSSIGAVFRLEYRVDDWNSDFGSIGAFKVFPEYRLTDLHQWVGVGGGLEVHRIGVWLSYNRRLANDDYSVRIGLQCRLNIKTKPDERP
ncbi:MAG TPA: hypothetical protein PLB89_17920 [Flavobacteriales bacterium]|nr:hypothetical protein [Flavobacteriales bacterium]